MHPIKHGTIEYHPDQTRVSDSYLVYIQIIVHILRTDSSGAADVVWSTRIALHRRRTSLHLKREKKNVEIYLFNDVRHTL